MENIIDTIIGIVVFLAIVGGWIFKIIKGVNGNNSFDIQDKINGTLKDIFSKKSPSADNEVKIYDENGNIINYNKNDNIADDNDIVIYDEDGNVMSIASTESPQPPPAPPSQPVTSTTREQAARSVDEQETQTNANAEMYKDFIKENGGSAIVIQEILAKPLALRD